LVRIFTQTLARCVPVELPHSNLGHQSGPEPNLMERERSCLLNSAHIGTAKLRWCPSSSVLPFFSPRADVVDPRLNLLEPRLAESHLTVSIPLHHRILFIGLTYGAQISSRLTEVSQSLNPISWIQLLTCRFGRGQQRPLSPIRVCCCPGIRQRRLRSLTQFGCPMSAGRFHNVSSSDSSLGSLDRGR